MRASYQERISVISFTRGFKKAQSPPIPLLPLFIVQSGYAVVPPG